MPEPVRTSRCDKSSAVLQDGNQVWDEFVARRGRQAASLQDFELGRTIGKGRYARVRQASLKEHKELPVCLKVLKKTEVVKLEQAEHVINEKNVLTSITSPFVIRVLCTFQDPRYLYIAMELVNGGELFTLLRAQKRFTEEATQFYAAEMVSAISHLHSMLIVFRDMKPENILVHQSGHLKLTDFGFAKYLKDGKTNTVCGTSEYMAPEIVKKSPYGLMVDWWSLGVLTYEMLNGQSPFNAAEEATVLSLVLSARVAFSAAMSKASQDFCGRLINKVTKSRLGSPELAERNITVKGHAFFKGLDWDDLEAGRLKPPFVPEIGESMDHVEFYEESAGEPEPPCEQDFSNWDDVTSYAEEGRRRAIELEKMRQDLVRSHKEEEARKQLAAENALMQGVSEEATTQDLPTGSSKKSQPCCSTQ